MQVISNLMNTKSNIVDKCENSVLILTTFISFLCKLIINHIHVKSFNFVLLFLENVINNISSEYKLGRESFRMTSQIPREDVAM